MTHEPGEVTRLLGRAREGDRPAISQLFRVVYSELRGIAGNLMRNERPGHLLQPTALVNEVYLRLFRGQELSVQASVEFYRLSARVMRHVLIDESRRRDAGSRRGIAVELQDHHAVAKSPEPLLDLCSAVRRLAKHDARAGLVVDLHYFSGRDVGEIARMLSLTERTIQRDLRVAQAWLRREITGTTHVTRAMGKS